MSASSFINRRPWLVLTTVLLVSAAAGLFATRVNFESAIEVWFLESDPALVTYDAFTGQFAADELVVLAVSADGSAEDASVFSQHFFAALAALTVEVAEAPHVHRVRSVLDFELDPPVPFDEEGEGEEEYLTDDAFPAPPIDWAAKAAEAVANALVTPSLVSADGRTAALLIEVERAGNTVEGKRVLVEALDEIISRESRLRGLAMQITGTPVLDHQALVHNDRDLRQIYPLIAPLILLFCWLVFGSLRLALIPLGVVVAAAVWAFGFMGLLGLKTTLLSSAMVPLFLAIGVADAVHVLTRYQHQRIAGESVSEAIAATMQRLWKPCLFTSITTAAGLCALLVSDLSPVREFGITAAVGVLAAFVVTMTLVPALLTLLGERLPARAPKVTSLLNRAVRQFVAPPHLIRRFALTVGLLIALLSIASATRIEVGVNPMSWFAADDPFRQATQLVDAELGGGTAVEFLVTSTDGSIAERGNLVVLDGFERWLEQSTLVTGCISVVELLKEATRTLSDEAGRVPRLPGMEFMTRSLLDQLAVRGELDRWLSDDGSSGRISCRVPLAEAADLGAELIFVQSEITRRFTGTNLDVQPTGYGVLMVQMEHHLIRSQLLTVSIAFAVVMMMLILLIRSASLAAIAMLPNLLPVLVGLGLMPVLGISLNPGTVMVAAVALGIVVDDTAHLLVAMRRHMAAGKEPDLALTGAIEDVGGPVLLTSLIMVGCMSVLMLGSFAPGVHFGAIATVIVLVALLSDLYLLPQLLARVPVGRWLKSTSTVYEQ